MTKDEIKKALECCEKYAYCKDCPCYTYCEHELHKGALALITEQEKEIDFQVQDRARLQREIDELEQAHEQRVEEIKRLKEVIEVFKNDTECNLNHITVENGQLKAKNKVLKDGIVKAFTNGFNEGRKQVEKDIRRAKINAMNELKEKIVEHMGNREYMGVKYKQGVFSESEIDEFIKEVQDETR